MTTKASSAVTLTTVGSVATLTFNRPERLNAWGADISKGLTDRLREVERDKEINVCVLTGKGRAFSAGANLQDPSTHRTESVEEFLENISVLSGPSIANVFDAIIGFTKPLIAAVNGYTVGIGFLTTLCCDIIIAAESAQFWLPQTAMLGILPAYAGTARLAQWVGRGRAMEIALSGRRVTASEGHDIGLVSRVVPDQDLSLIAAEVAAQLANVPPLAAKLTKESLNFAFEVGSLRLAGMADLYRFMALTLTDESQQAHLQWRSRPKNTGTA